MDTYEQKYKEALEVAKRKLCFDKAGMVDSFTPNDIYDMFPELKESEDEKIRKELIGFLRNIPNSNYTCEEMALWLEKQGGQKQETNYPKFDFSDILAIHCCMETAEKVTEDKELYEKLKSLHSRLHDAYWIEKQSDKPQGKTALEAINEEKVNNANKVEPKDYSSIDPHFGKPIDKVEPKFKVKYAGNEYNVLEVKDIAGVTFYGIEDEPNHIDYVKAENCERVDGYNIKESGSLYPTKSAMFSKQNPAWSEEDESWFKEMELMCLYFSKDTDYRAEFSTWLKSLKDRVKIQQEWTMQDEEELQIALDTLVKAGQHSSVKWLKNVCLVPQNKWKPSDEQMKVLEAMLTVSPQSPTMTSTLIELYEDLKKLRVE